MQDLGKVSPDMRRLSEINSKLYNIFDFNSEYPIGIRICSLLSISDIINISRTCKALSGYYQSLLPSQWNINRSLASFVKDVIGFRSQMARSGALISGSFALQFFRRVYWIYSDLDINIREGANEFEQYLCSQEGYQLKRSTNGGEYSMVGVDKVLFTLLWCLRIP